MFTTFPPLMAFLVMVLDNEIMGFPNRCQCFLRFRPSSKFPSIEIRNMPRVAIGIGLLWGRWAIVQHVPRNFVRLRHSTAWKYFSFFGCDGMFSLPSLFIIVEVAFQLKKIKTFHIKATQKHQVVDHQINYFNLGQITILFITQTLR